MSEAAAEAVAYVVAVLVLVLVVGGAVPSAKWRRRRHRPGVRRTGSGDPGEAVLGCVEWAGAVGNDAHFVTARRRPRPAHS